MLARWTSSCYNSIHEDGMPTIIEVGNMGFMFKEE